jgi:hypothetical protein
MKRNDDLFLEQLYQEGIWDRLKGQGAGIKQGAGTILKNVGGKLTGDTGPRPSARSEYAKAQQSSLLKSFLQKVNNEISDFKNDLKAFKVDPDPAELEKNWPTISQRLKDITELEKFISTQSSTKPEQTQSTTSAQKPATDIAQPTEKPSVLTNTEDYFNLKDAAEYLKISETEMQNKAATGKVKAVMVSGEPRFKKSDLDAMTPTATVTPSATPQAAQSTEAKPVNANTPKKGDKVTYNNDPNYEFNGTSWVYKGTEIKSAKLADNLNKAWATQKSTKPATKAVPKKATAKPTAKAAPKKVMTKPTKTAPKKPAAKPIAKTVPKKAAIKPRRVVNASYNPFENFLKECNLL